MSAVISPLSNKIATIFSAVASVLKKSCYIAQTVDTLSADKDKYVTKTISITVEATEVLSLADRSSEEVSEVAAVEASVVALLAEEASEEEEPEANSN